MAAKEEAQVQEREPFHKVYRPRMFEEVIGQATAIKVLQRVIKDRTSQAFLFTGPAGTGKTTLARNTAHALGIPASNVQEIAAAVYTGVDDMRKLVDGMQFKSLGKSDRKAIILDEAHRLSGQAWDSLLKATEEPPKHVFWFLCTTDPAKVPKTIQTRFTTVNTRELDDKDLAELIDWVCKEEKIKLNQGIKDLIIKEARGSGRQALTYLAAVYDLKDRKEAADAMMAIADDADAIELARFLLKGGDWSKAVGIVSRIDKSKAEGVRIVVSNYIAAVLKNSKSEKDAMYLLNVLDSFSTPYRNGEGFSSLILSVGKAMFNGG